MNQRTIHALYWILAATIALALALMLVMKTTEIKRPVQQAVMRVT